MFGIAWQLIKGTWAEFSDDRAFRLSAALSYYTALSLAPLLLVVIAIAGMVFGENAARGEVVGQIEGLIGAEGAEMIQTMLARSQPADGGILSLVIGVAVLLVGATSVFAQLQDALNTVWDVDQEASPGGVWRMIKDRLLSFGMVCGMAFLLLVSLVLSALMSGLNDVIREWLPGVAGWLWVGDVLLTAVLAFGLFAMIFKFLPHTAVSWSDVWVGAAITAVLFIIGKYALGLYFGQVAVGTTFGAAGSFVVLLTWLYYSSAIMLFGAEFTQVYATRYGTRAGRADAAEVRQPEGHTAGHLGRAPA
jgi:membrane protein